MGGQFDWVLPLGNETVSFSHQSEGFNHHNKRNEVNITALGKFKISTPSIILPYNCILCSISVNLLVFMANIISKYAYNIENINQIIAGVKITLILL